MFAGQPFEDYVRDLVARLREGELDDQLVYRKRLRRRLDEYQRSVPPHVQAARLQREREHNLPGRGDWIAYVITLQGAEPAVDFRATLDYDHYIEKQLTPVADGILHFLDTSFEEICGRQQALF